MVASIHGDQIGPVLGLWAIFLTLGNLLKTLAPSFHGKRSRLNFTKDGLSYILEAILSQKHLVALPVSNVNLIFF
jgi:hypothetical protein